MISDYDRWDEVLGVLGLKMLPDLEPYETGAMPTAHRGDEGVLHESLKMFLSKNPDVLGFHERPVAETEHCLPSGDRVDVLFSCPTYLVGVEVKTSGAVLEEIERGIFQTVKYRAVLEAVQLASGQFRSVRSVLAIGGALPLKAKALVKRLGIVVHEDLEAYLAT